MTAQSQNLHIVVIGGGLGGLAAAIAFRHRQFEVTVLESAPEFRSLGGMLGIMPNGTRLLDRWCPALKEDIYNVATKAEIVSMRHWKDGKVLLEEKIDVTDSVGYRILPGSRTSYHRFFLDHAQNMGAKVVFDARAVKFHDELPSQPFVITEKGAKFEGDIIVCFDGVKSRARDYVLGYAAPPIPSGYSCFRGYVSGKTLAADPETAWLVDGDKGHFWLGDDRHITAHSFLGGKDWYYGLTRPDSVQEAERESYFAPGKVEDVLKLVEGWDPKLLAALAKTEECLDWRICHRPRLASWTSKNGRLIIAGDAAHPVSPTSAQGATQAIEDAGVISYCLSRTPDDIPLAVHAVEYLRMDRVASVYEMGEKQRADWQRKDETGRKFEKDNVAMKARAYFGFDAEKDAAERYDEAVAQVKNNTSSK